MQEVIRIQENPKNALRQISKDFKLLILSPEEKRTFLLSMVRAVGKKARDHYRNQSDVEGSAWEQRKKGKKRMERKVSLQKNMRFYGDSLSATVTYKNPLTGSVARKQQEGAIDIGSVKQLQKKEASFNIDRQKKGSCPRSLAKKLVENDFTLKSKNGRRKVSVKWIMDNISLGQAGAIYHTIVHSAHNQVWQIRTPARSFLGASQADQDKMGDAILDKINSKMK